MNEQLSVNVDPGTRRGQEAGTTDRGHHRVLDLLNERLQFESLLSRLSATFINLPAEDVDSQIESGLQQIVEFLGIERSSLGQFSEDGSQLVVTHSYAVSGTPPSAALDLAKIWPWYTEQIRRGKLLRFTRLPEELPPEAIHEREHVEQAGGPRSHLAIPFKVGDAILGGIGFGSFRERDWSDDLVRSLQLVGEIFANALARKRADILLRESEGRFRLMADTAPVMVWMSGRDKLCSYFNKPWLDFTGRPIQSQLGDGWSAAVHSDDLPRCLDTYSQAFDARQEFRMEYRLQRFDGEFRWILDAGVPRFESDGTFEGYIGSCIDITDQKRVEEALRQNEARLRFLLESTHATPWLADAQAWRFTFVGPQAAMLLGYPAEAWYEENFWLDHIHPDDREQAVAFCLDHSRRDTDYQLEYRMVAADGRIVWIHDIVNVIRQGGAPTSLRGFMVDVTALRSAEEESRNLRDQLARAGRVQTLGQLAASIAHEVNQPLCAIVSNAQTLRRIVAAGGFDMGEFQEALQDITQDGQRASAVIARIRGLLQKAPTQRAPVDVNELIREVAVLMGSEAVRRGVAVKFQLAEDLPAVLGDRVQLQQVILNLMGNGADALDGVPRERRELVIRSTAEGAGGIAVAVQDSGIGIDPRNLGYIFDALYTTKPGGMGMGLAICKSIIENHGGRISASLNTGGGSTLRFTVPGLKDPDS